MSTLKVINLVHPSGGSNTVSMDTNGNLTVTGSVVGGSPMSGMRNRIINGDMRIDQRNAGGSLTITTDSTYTVDRWVARASQSSKMSVQQTPSATETGYATRLGAGFSGYTRVTSSSAYSISVSDYFALAQYIEGLNVADLAWGTSSAKSITLSFWVNCSLTGTFGGSLVSGSNDYSYPFSYTINSANTWEYKTITVTGPTSGTWVTTNSISIKLFFGLGINSSQSAAAGTWLAGSYLSSTGATSLVAVNGATWNITGVQLEAGTAATPFERRQYGQELALCMRYYQKTYDIGTAPASATYVNMYTFPIDGNGTINYNYIQYVQPMRASPTVNFYDGLGAANVCSRYRGGWTNGISSSFAVSSAGSTAWVLQYNGQPFGTGTPTCIHYTASAEL